MGFEPEPQRIGASSLKREALQLGHGGPTLNENVTVVYTEFSIKYGYD